MVHDWIAYDINLYDIFRCAGCNSIKMFNGLGLSQNKEEKHP